MLKNSRQDNPCYCINLRRTANILTKFYDRAFAPINLTTNQFSLIYSIKLLNGCNKSELAQYVRLDRTTIIRSLGILQQRNLIEEVSGLNNRNKVIQLTKGGEAAVTAGFEIWKQVQRDVKQVIGEENELALEKLCSNIELLEP